MGEMLAVGHGCLRACLKGSACFLGGLDACKASVGVKESIWTGQGSCGTGDWWVRGWWGSAYAALLRYKCACLSVGCMQACFCGGKVREEETEEVDDAKRSRRHVENPSSPPPVMEPVLSIACHGSVMGQERNVFVALKKCLMSSNVRVTQLSRPCDVLLVFHDITSGADTKQLLNKVGDAAGELYGP